METTPPHTHTQSMTSLTCVENQISFVVFSHHHKQMEASGLFVSLFTSYK